MPQTFRTAIKKMANNSKITLFSTSKNSSCEIYLHGAHITSWKVNNKERIFTSKKALFNKPGKAIRGGIPICFPYFRERQDLQGPAHGFARISNQWKIVDQSKNGDSVVLELTDWGFSRLIWDNKFRMIYEVKVTDCKLVTSLMVANLNDNGQDFDFTAVMFNHFRVPDVRDVKISGLDKCFSNKNTSSYTNIGKIMADQNKEFEKHCPKIRSSDEHHIKFIEKETNKPKVIAVRKKSNSPDTLIWNPWAEKARKLPDFGDEEYLEMICVGVGCKFEKRVLKAGESFVAKQEFEEIL